MVCANQCSGRGDCWLGFCRCHPGWWGHDCAHRDPDVALPAHPGAGPLQCPGAGGPWLRVQRPVLHLPRLPGRALPSSVTDVQLGPAPDTASCCRACAHKPAALHGGAGSRPGCAGEAPAHLRVRPARRVQHAHDAVPRGQGRSLPCCRAARSRRPRQAAPAAPWAQPLPCSRQSAKLGQSFLSFLTLMAAQGLTLVLAAADDADLVQGACSWRQFSEGNRTDESHWTYSIETALHEWLLQSEHRVLEPDQADLFYAPVYTSCFMHPIMGWADFPWFYGPSGANALGSWPRSGTPPVLHAAGCRPPAAWLLWSLQGSTRSPAAVHSLLSRGRAARAVTGQHTRLLAPVQGRG